MFLNINFKRGLEMKIKNLLAFILVAFALLFIIKAQAAVACHNCHHEAISQVSLEKPVIPARIGLFDAGSFQNFKSFSNYKNITSNFSDLASFEQESPSFLLNGLSADPKKETWPARSVNLHLAAIKNGWPLEIVTKGFYTSMLNAELI